MNDDMKSLIKILGVAAGAYLLYQWLNSSGLWAQWFGGGNSFSNAQQLLAYCQANPSGSATFVNPQTGQSQTATCAAWMQANGAAPTSTAGATTTTTNPPPQTSAATASVQPAAASTMVPRLEAAAVANPVLGGNSANVSQWNFLLGQIWPSAPQISVTTPAGNNSIDAATYVGYYLGQGFPDPSLTATQTTGGGGAGMQGVAYQDDPYSWRN